MFLMFRKQVLCVPLVPSLNVLGHTSLNKLDVWNRHLPSRYLCPDSVCLQGPSQCRLNKQSFVVQLLSYVQIFATPWTAALQASLSSTISWYLLKFMPIESVVLVTILVSAILFFCLQSFPASGSFPVNQLFTPGGQSIGASALASVLPMNIQGWFPIGLIDFISLLSKGLSRVFSSTTVQKHHFCCTQASLWSNSHIHTWMTTGKTIALTNGPLSAKWCFCFLICYIGLS